MGQENQNPLASYFRTVGMHVMLPSGGRFFNEGEIELSINGEVAVLPMTSADELILKNPDSLLNGHAIEKLLQSCVPSIKSPRRIPTQDMDVLLLAIKACSYGDKLEITAKCPKCQHESSFELSVRHLLSTAKPLPESNEARISDEIVAYVKPYDFEAKTILDLAAFEETKLAQFIVTNQNISERERIQRFNESFDKIAGLNLDLLARCVTKIIVPGNEVTDQQYIREYIRNAPKDAVKKIQDAIKAFSECGVDKKIEAVCSSEKCGHKWETDLVFDPSHFFA